MSLNAYVKDTGMSGRRAPEGSQSELIVLLNPFLVNLHTYLVQVLRDSIPCVRVPPSSSSLHSKPVLSATRCTYILVCKLL